MKNILIIRSVSFQQLDLNLPAIKEKYGECNISLLTHEHGVKLAEKYADINKIYVYPYKEGFNINKKVDELRNLKFDVVIVPVTNITGSGFFNVLKFSKSINAEERVICNVVSELKPFSMGNIYSLQLKNYFMNIIAFICTTILSPFALIALLLRLKKIEK